MPHPIVACARGWIGTRFHHQGRLRKTESHRGGVDCLGLLVGIAQELDLRAPDGTRLAVFDKADYPHQPDVKRLYARLAELFAIVIPAKAGIQCAASAARKDLLYRAHGALLDSRFRGNDKEMNPSLTGEGILPGDIVLLKIDGSPQHLAIVSDMENGLGLIHAYAPARAVVEHRLDGWWLEKIEAAFRITS
ncbi:MAG: hypothetical protein KGI29_08895 [Pseudomonadota bacterium]|nr:hypothetical protein [Pseudomonadota bacterium]MDE3037125.1 hypothetical protein [Pseudomonadota bacterium]